MTTTNETDEPIILKTDVLGRVKMPAARRERLLDEFEQSGLSGTKFASLVGIKYQTFATWVQRRRRQPGSTHVSAKVSQSVRWLEAVVEGAEHTGSKSRAVLALQLPGGVRMEVTDERQAVLAAALIQALVKPC